VKSVEHHKAHKIAMKGGSGKYIWGIEMRPLTSHLHLDRTFHLSYRAMYWIVVEVRLPAHERVLVLLVGAVIFV
jgi:hypothetical protein